MGRGGRRACYVYYVCGPGSEFRKVGGREKNKMTKIKDPLPSASPTPSVLLKMQGLPEFFEHLYCHRHFVQMGMTKKQILSHLVSYLTILSSLALGTHVRSVFCKQPTQPACHQVRHMSLPAAQSSPELMSTATPPKRLTAHALVQQQYLWYHQRRRRRQARLCSYLQRSW